MRSNEETEYDEVEDEEAEPYLAARPRHCRKCEILLIASTWPLHRLKKHDYICGPCHRRMALAYAAGTVAPRPLRPITLYTHMPFGKYRGFLLKNVPDDYFARFLPKKLSRSLQATVDAEIARRKETPALLPPPDHHPDFNVVASNPDGLVMGIYGWHYHRPGCVALRKQENIPHASFVNGRDREGNSTLIETEPCTRCAPPRFGLDALLYPATSKEPR